MLKWSSRVAATCCCCCCLLHLILASYANLIFYIAVFICDFVTLIAKFAIEILRKNNNQWQQQQVKWHHSCLADGISNVKSFIGIWWCWWWWVWVVWMWYFRLFPSNCERMSVCLCVCAHWFACGHVFMPIDKNWPQIHIRKRIYPLNIHTHTHSHTLKVHHVSKRVFNIEIIKFNVIDNLLLFFFLFLLSYNHNKRSVSVARH